MNSPVLIASWTTWLALAAPWASLGITTLVLVAVLRSRWKTTPLLTRCVVGSLYAHLLFATLAYTTNFTSWRPPGFGPGRGSGPVTREVRVKIAHLEPEAVATAPSVPELLVREEPPVKPEPANQQSAISNPQPPPLNQQSAISNQQSPPALEAVVETKAEIAPRYAESVQAAPASVPKNEVPPRRAVAKTVSLPTASSFATPDLYKLRFGDRSAAMESAGGNPDTEAAVKLALAWLVANQETDGRWSASRHGAGRGAPQQGQDRGDTGADADTGITSLALLTFMGAGHTHLEGEHRLAVQHGLEYLLGSQRSDGCLAGNAKLFASMYCHGMAMLAIAEALALTHDPRLEPFVVRAVDYTVQAQHSGGGWRYQPHDQGDMSQFGWQIMALKSAELAGVKVPEATKLRAQRFLQSVASGQHGGLASYRAKERASRTMTAEALVCHHLLSDAPPVATRNEATAFVLQELPTAGAPNVYYWYYGTLAMRFSGGASWQKWNEALQKQLLQTQRRDALTAGSWDPDRTWGGYGGRVYQTSLSALCLEAYYRYDIH